MRSTVFALLFFICGHGHAIVLELQPAVQTAAVGEIVEYDIIFDPDGDLPLYGQLSIYFDAGKVELIDYRHGPLGDPQFLREPRKADGGLERIEAFNPIGFSERGVWGTLRFRVLAEGVSRIDIEAPFLGWYDETVNFLRPETKHALLATHGTAYPLMKISKDQVFDPIPVNEIGFTEVTVFNDGTGPLHMDNAELDLPFFFGVGFTIETDDCSGRSIAPRGSCHVGLSYTSDRFLSQREHSTNLVLSSSDILQIDTSVKLTSRIASPRITLPEVEFLEGRTEALFKSDL